MGSKIDDIWDDDYTIRKKYANDMNLSLNQVIITDGKPENITTLFPEIEDIYDEDLLNLINDIYVAHSYLNKKDILFNYIYYNEERILKYKAEDFDSDEARIKNYIYNNLYDLLESNIFNTQQSDDGFVIKLYQKYKVWKNNITEEKYRDEVSLMNIVYDKLEKQNYENILNTPPLIVGTTIVYLPEKIAGGSISPVDGIGIFDNIIISDQLPIVKYVSDKGLSHYKTTSRLDVDNNKLNIKKADSNNFIYFKLCTAKKGLQYDTPDEQLVTFSYDLTNNRLRSKISINEKTFTIDEIKGILIKSFPLLSFNNIEKNDIKAIIEFYRFNPRNTNEITKISMIPQLVSMLLRRGNEMTKPSSIKNNVDIREILGMYMFFDETEKLMIDSKTVRLNLMSLTSNSRFGEMFKKDVKFKDISNCLFSLINEEKPGGKIVMQSENDTIEEIDFGDDAVNCVQLKIKRCKDEKTLNILIRLFKIFINYYKELESNRIELINKLAFNIFNAGNFANGIIGLESFDKENKKKEGLKDVNSEIFPPGYIRFCQPHRPIIITEEERYEWESKTITNKDGTKSPWPTMLFPRSEPESEPEVQYRMVCPNPEAPYIGVRKNTTLPNSDKYEYLPCCFKKDQMNPSKSSPYNIYYNSVDNRKTKEKTNYIVKGEKKLDPNQSGEMSPLFEKLVNVKDSEIGVRRLGISKRKDSFISCVLTAVEYNFAGSRDQIKRVLEIRKQMLQYINCMRQELYHLSDQQVTKILEDPDSYIDPGLFYRSLEEIFDINIYTVNMSKELIEIPNCWRFHVRYYKEREMTIIIYKNYGNDSSEIPNCELVTSFPKDRPTFKGYHFSNDINKVFHKFLIDKSSTVTWIQGDGFRNLFKTDYTRLKGVNIIAQYIDSYGKVRLLEISVEESVFTIMVHPGQPLNLPILKEIKRLDYQKATEFFGSAVTSVDKKSNGVWFQMYDIEEGIFVFVNKLPNVELKQTTDVFFGGIVESSINEPCKRFRKMEKTSNIIIVLTEWLYDLYILGTPFEKRDQRTQRFIDTRMVHDNFKGDSSTYYDISEVKYHLPTRIKYEEAFEYVSKIFPKFVKNRQLVYFDKTFKDKMVKYILSYSNKIKGIDPMPKSYIRNYYKCLDDFSSMNNTLIFKGSRDYMRWLKTSSERYQIKAKLSVDQSRQIIPYEFIRKGRYYIVQNVIKGDIKRCFNACMIWQEKGYNPGFTVDAVEQQLITEIPYKLYGINAIGELVLIDEVNITGTGYYEVLCYGDCNQSKSYRRFAAMLPLN